jgi:tRNA 2-thiouridine synthesizing protein A
MQKLDVRGEICPYPMLRTVEALKKLPAGEGLEVVTDHPPALSTIPWEAAKLGYEATLSEAGHAEWRIDLRPAAARKKPNEVLDDLNRQLAGLSLPE